MLNSQARKALFAGIACSTPWLAHAAAPSAPQPAPPNDSTPVQAVWVDKDVAFTYVGFTTHYSCDGIRDKVEHVLKKIGVRPGYKVTVTGCFNPDGGPELMPRVRVRAATPSPATPELLSELRKNAAKADLEARAGAHRAAESEVTAEFPATWRRVEFQSSPNGRIEDGDCELMEQLVREVLVPLGARVASESTINCVPHQLTINAVNVQLDVLTAPPAQMEKTPEKRT